MERRLVAALLRHRLAVLLLVGLISAVAAVHALRVRFDSSIEIWFLDDDPGLVTYHAFLDRFEADEIAVLGVFAGDVFAPDVLAAVDRMTRAAEDAPYVYRVRSLTNVRVAEATGDSIEIAPLVDELPATPAQAAALRDRALTRKLVVDNLVSADGRATAIVVEMDHRGNSFEGKVALVRALDEIRRREAREGLRVLLTGSPVFDDAFFRYTERDSLLLAPAMIGLVLLVTWLVFRRLSAALVPLSVVLLATLWTFGLMGALGIEVNLITTILVPLILAVGVADSIHMLAEYYHELMRGESRERAVEISAAHLLVPCLFTSATTVAGMLSLRVSSLAPVREFGWLAAVAVSFAFLLSVGFVPVLLQVVRAPDAEFLGRQRRGPLQWLLERLGRPDRRQSRVVLAASAALVVLAVWGIARLQMGSNPMNYFRPSDPVRTETEELDRALGGSTSIEFLVEAPGGGLKEPEQLRRLEAFQQWLETSYPQSIHRVLSAVDSLKELHRILNAGDPAAEVIPATRRLAAQLYLLLEGEEDFEAMVQDDYSVGRVTARVNMSAAGTVAQALDEIQARLAPEHMGPDLRVEPTGFVQLMGSMEEYLLSSQKQSFLLAFLVVSAMMVMLLGSLRLGLFSLIPNLVPIALGLGFMGFVGIPLDPGTVMIGSLALGLVVDDTVHFLVRLKRHVRAGASLEAAIEATMREAGRAIVVTSVVLACGFGVMTLASFTPNVYFGLISALVILVALAADLVVLPAALLVLRPALGPADQRPASSQEL